MQRWNQLVPEWKSFRYHVNSPLSRGTCMASRSMHILMSHFCDTQMGGICHIFVLSLQDALKFTLIKLTITRNSPYSSLDFEVCLGFQNIEDAKIACGDMCHPREKWSQHFVIKLNRSTQIYWRRWRCMVRKKCAKQFAKVQQNRLQSRSTSQTLSFRPSCSKGIITIPLDKPPPTG